MTVSVLDSQVQISRYQKQFQGSGPFSLKVFVCSYNNSFVYIEIPKGGDKYKCWLAHFCFLLTLNQRKHQIPSEVGRTKHQYHSEQLPFHDALPPAIAPSTAVTQLFSVTNRPLNTNCLFVWLFNIAVLDNFNFLVYVWDTCKTFFTSFTTLMVLLVSLVIGSPTMLDFSPFTDYTFFLILYFLSGIYIY